MTGNGNSAPTEPRRTRSQKPHVEEVERRRAHAALERSLCDHGCADVLDLAEHALRDIREEATKAASSRSSTTVALAERLLAVIRFYERESDTPL